MTTILSRTKAQRRAAVIQAAQHLVDAWDGRNKFDLTLCANDLTNAVRNLERKAK